MDRSWTSDKPFDWSRAWFDGIRGKSSFEKFHSGLFLESFEDFQSFKFTVSNEETHPFSNAQHVNLALWTRDRFSISQNLCCCFRWQKIRNCFFFLQLAQDCYEHIVQTNSESVFFSFEILHDVSKSENCIDSSHSPDFHPIAFGLFHRCFYPRPLIGSFFCVFDRNIAIFSRNFIWTRNLTKKSLIYFKKILKKVILAPENRSKNMKYVLQCETRRTYFTCGS